MKKEEILAKSKEENRRRDPFKMEIQSKAERLSGLGALALATILFVIESISGNGFNYALYAVTCSFGTISWIVKAIYLKEKKYIILSVIFLIVTLAFTVIHITNLLS